MLIFLLAQFLNRILCCKRLTNRGLICSAELGGVGGSVPPVIATAHVQGSLLVLLSLEKMRLDIIFSFYCIIKVSSSSLKLQKRLAAAVLKCGKRKIWLDPNEATEISNANSRKNNGYWNFIAICHKGQSVRKLVKDGLIIKKPQIIHSRSRVRRAMEAKRKGRHSGGCGRDGVNHA